MRRARWASPRAQGRRGSRHRFVQPAEGPAPFLSLGVNQRADELSPFGDVRVRRQVDANRQRLPMEPSLVLIDQQDLEPVLGADVGIRRQEAEDIGDGRPGLPEASEPPGQAFVLIQAGIGIHRPVTPVAHHDQGSGERADVLRLSGNRRRWTAPHRHRPRGPSGIAPAAITRTGARPQRFVASPPRIRTQRCANQSRTRPDPRPGSGSLSGWAAGFVHRVSQVGWMNRMHAAGLGFVLRGSPTTGRSTIP